MIAASTACWSLAALRFTAPNISDTLHALQYYRGVITVGTASAVFGGIWRYLAVFGGIGRYWAVLGGIGRYWAVLGGIGRYWAVLGGIGRYLAVFGGIWRYLAVFGICVFYASCQPSGCIRSSVYISITAINDH